MKKLHNIQEYYEVAERLVRNVGKIIENASDTKKNARSKGIDWDLVTEYDGRIEDELVKQLSELYPTHKFIGEETAAREKCQLNLTDEPTWIIDPIDGTANFVHQFPYSCISLALSINKQIEIGIIYNPLMNQFFSARRNMGAFMNGKPIRTSEVQDVSEGLIAMEPWIAKDLDYLVNTYTRMHALIHGTHGIRSMGSAALTLCYVAMGAFEAYYVESVDSWDVAAGKLIIEEAGGVVIDVEGGELDLIKPRVIAACNKNIATQLVDLFKKADSKPVHPNLN